MAKAKNCIYVHHIQVEATKFFSSYNSMTFQIFYLPKKKKNKIWDHVANQLRGSGDGWHVSAWISQYFKEFCSLRWYFKWRPTCELTKVSLSHSS